MVSSLPAMKNQPSRKLAEEPRPQDCKERMLEQLLLMIQEFPASTNLNGKTFRKVKEKIERKKNISLLAPNHISLTISNHKTKETLGNFKSKRPIYNAMVNGKCYKLGRIYARCTHSFISKCLEECYKMFFRIYKNSKRGWA